MKKKLNWAVKQQKKQVFFTHAYSLIKKIKIKAARKLRGEVNLLAALASGSSFMGSKLQSWVAQQLAFAPLLKNKKIYNKIK